MKQFFISVTSSLKCLFQTSELLTCPNSPAPAFGVTFPPSPPPLRGLFPKGALCALLPASSLCPHKVICCPDFSCDLHKDDPKRLSLVLTFLQTNFNLLLGHTAWTGDCCHKPTFPKWNFFLSTQAPKFQNDLGQPLHSSASHLVTKAYRLNVH